MEEVKHPHDGRYNINLTTTELPDHLFQAGYEISERPQIGESGVLKRWTGETYGNREDANAAADQAAKEWLEEFRPVNG